MMSPPIACYVDGVLPDKDNINRWRNWIKLKLADDLRDGQTAMVDLIFDLAVRGVTPGKRDRKAVQQAVAKTLHEMADRLVRPDE